MYDNDINKQLDKLQNMIQKKEFLESKGMGGEFNIWICGYDPKEEMRVRHFTERLAANKALKCRIIKQDLYKIFLSICEDIGIVNAIKAIEKNKGSKHLLKKLHESIEAQDFIKKMRYTHHEKGDVLIITGVGEVFPFMRVHTLLAAMQKEFLDVPIVVLYPGTYNDINLKLFDRLTPNDYYRACSNMIQEDTK